MERRYEQVLCRGELDKRSPLAARPSSAAGASGLGPSPPPALPSIILYLVNSLQRAWGPPVNYHFRKSLQRTHSILSYLLTTCSYREKSR